MPRIRKAGAALPRHPRQPLVIDAYGTARFHANAIVRHLLDHGGQPLTHLATLPFSAADWAQFYQLIGYSLTGWHEMTDDATAHSARERRVLASLEQTYSAVLAEQQAHAELASTVAEAPQDTYYTGVADGLDLARELYAEYTTPPQKEHRL